MPLEALTRLAVEEHTRPEQLAALRPEWEELWRRCPTATPFQSAAWLLPWWKQFGTGEAWVLALRSGGRLAGLVPLYVYRKPGSEVRELFLVGIGTSDYLDGLWEPGSERACAEAVLRHLEEHRHRWDVCDLQQLRPGSPLLETPAPDGWSDERSAQDVCPVLRLPGSAEELDRVLPGHLVHNQRYYRRRAERLGRVEFEAATSGNLDELFAALCRLHAARWSARGLPGVLADGCVEACHREAAPALLAEGLLRMWALRLDGRIIACFYGWTDRQRPCPRAYYYLSGFDPELRQLSPGTLVIGHAIREAVREGAGEFDFLRGPEPYKYLWGATDRTNYRRVLRAR